MKKLWPGDTLIEVLFAFAILSLVISVMFSGAMGSYKTALTAQDRTTALFVAQYQADGLKTYRDSLGWDTASGQAYTFLDGNVNDATDTRLIKVRDITVNTGVFCMNIPKNNSGNWKIIKDNYDALCNTDSNSVAKTLAPNLNSPTISITRGDLTNDNSSILFTIKVKWKARNSSIDESVTNTILLTKQR
jgi:type II secretory pathway pseudopilin PulG